MEIQYYIFPTSLTVILDDKVYHISSGSLRFDEAIKAIESDKTEDLLEIVDPTLRLGVEGFSVRDGLVYFKEEPLPGVISNQLLLHKIDSTPFMGLVNFWLNLKFRTDFQKAKDSVIKMLELEAYPLTNDGFIILYNGESILQDSITNVPFYSYAYAAEHFKSLFRQRKELASICQETFGFYSKKLNKLVLEKLLNKETMRVETHVFNYGFLFKENLSSDNIFRLMENDDLAKELKYLHTATSVSGGQFLKRFTEKKILNLFNKTNENNSMTAVVLNFNYIAQYYKRLEENNVSLDYVNMKDFEEMVNAIKREMDKLSHPLYELKQEENVAALKNIKTLSINKEWNLVVPQTSHDLMTWGREMNNCIYGFSELALSGECLILGVAEKDSGKIIFNIEIRNKRIKQFVCNRNVRVESSMANPVLDFLKHNGIIEE